MASTRVTGVAVRAGDWEVEKVAMYEDGGGRVGGGVSEGAGCCCCGGVDAG